MSATIVTLTGFADIFAAFRASVERHEPAARKVVVLSGSMSSNRTALMDMMANGTWTAVQGIEPFVFARNANMGIAATAPDDVLLVNDDVTFEGPILADLSRIANANPHIGILSLQFRGGGTGNALQNAPPYQTELTYTEERLCFTCVYIRRAVLEEIGPLDERFVNYGCEDSDWSLRVQRAGYKLAVAPNLYVRHGFGEYAHSNSFRRTDKWAPSGIDPKSQKLFFDKWGKYDIL